MTAKVAEPTKATRLAASITAKAHRLYALPCGVWGTDPGSCEFWGKLGKFTVVGGTGVIVNSIALFLLYDKVQLPLILASAIAVEIAIISNFYFNNRWTFKAKGILFSRFAKFNVVSLGGLAITTATLWTLATYLGLHYLFANLVGIALATAWNFAANLVWTWGWE